MKNNLFTRQLGEYFEVYLPIVHGASENTVSSYADAFALFFRFLHEQKGLQHYLVKFNHLTASLFDEFVLWMGNTCGYSSSTKRHRMTVITSFLKYASRREMSALSAYSSASNTETPTVIQSDFPYFTVEEIKTILSMPNPNQRLGIRDMTVLSLLYDTAARSQELCDLCLRNLRFGKPTTVKLQGKRGKPREVPISDEVTNLLRYYLKNSNLNMASDREHQLFSSQTYTKMTTACVRNLTQKYIQMAKASNPILFLEDSYSPHSFRHSKAVHMVEAGVNLIYIRNFLGHASIKSTEIYARVSQAAVSKALRERKIPRPVGEIVVTASQAAIPLPDCIKASR
jgi:site-specific recombinase XerD